VPNQEGKASFGFSDLSADISSGRCLFVKAINPSYPGRKVVPFAFILIRSSNYL
jgi:hypothetical protein